MPSGSSTLRRRATPVATLSSISRSHAFKIADPPAGDLLPRLHHHRPPHRRAPTSRPELHHELSSAAAYNQAPPQTAPCRRLQSLRCLQQPLSDCQPPHSARRRLLSAGIQRLKIGIDTFFTEFIIIYATCSGARRRAYGDHSKSPPTPSSARASRTIFTPSSGICR